MSGAPRQSPASPKVVAVASLEGSEALASFLARTRKVQVVAGVSPVAVQVVASRGAEPSSSKEPSISTSTRKSFSLTEMAATL